MKDRFLKMYIIDGVEQILFTPEAFKQAEVTPSKGDKFTYEGVKFTIDVDSHSSDGSFWCSYDRIKALEVLIDDENETVVNLRKEGMTNDKEETAVAKATKVINKYEGIIATIKEKNNEEKKEKKQDKKDKKDSKKKDSKKISKEKEGAEEEEDKGF